MAHGIYQASKLDDETISMGLVSFITKITYLFGFIERITR